MNRSKDFSELVARDDGQGGDLFLDPPPEELIQEEASLLVKPYAIEVIHSEGVSIPRGGEGNYNFRVKNIGEKLDTYILSATSSLGWSKPDLMPEKVVLVPGEELIVPIKVTVPANALEGKRDKFTLKAVSLTVSLIEDWASTATVVSNISNIDIGVILCNIFPIYIRRITNSNGSSYRPIE